MSKPVKLGKIIQEIMRCLERRQKISSEKQHNPACQKQDKQDEITDRYPRTATIHI